MASNHVVDAARGNAQTAGRQGLVSAGRGERCLQQLALAHGHGLREVRVRGGQQFAPCVMGAGRSALASACIGSFWKANGVGVPRRAAGHGRDYVEVEHRVLRALGQSTTDQILELTNIARQLGLGYRIGESGSDSRRLSAPRRMLSDEMPDKQPNVLTTFREGRDASLEHGQPMKKVETKTPLSDEGREIPVGCGDDADIQSYFSICANGLYLAFLKCARSSLPCREKLEVGDLVQEQHAAVGGAEEAAMVFGRAGERSSSVAEQLTVGDAAAEGDAVHGNEGALLSLGIQPMDRTCDQLFARSGFARDQDRKVARRAHAPNPGVEREHGRCLADQAQRRHLGAECLRLYRVSAPLTRRSHWRAPGLF